MRRYHDNLVYRYIGVDKTIEQISRNYYFLNIFRKVRHYLKDYDIYQRNKLARHVPYGEL
jgi:hypothetical protein